MKAGPSDFHGDSLRPIDVKTRRLSRALGVARKSDTLYLVVAYTLPSPVTTLFENFGEENMIEDTVDALTKLFHLNHWAKAGEILTRRDRDVLYEIKGNQIRQLNKQGKLILSRVIERPNTLLNSLYSNAWSGPVIDCALDSIDATLEERDLREALDQLYHKAQDEDKPLDEMALDQLGVVPIAFGAEAGSLEEVIDNWDEVQFAIDPCWYWLAEYLTREALPRFCFHVPYRIAQEFFGVHDLAHSESESREFGEQFGRAITEEESLEFPILELVQFFGKREEDFPNKLRTRELIEAEIVREQATLLTADSRYEDNWDENDLGRRGLG